MANNHPNAPDTRKAQPPQQSLTVAPGVEVLPKERVEYLAETYDLKPPQVLVVRNAICVGATDAELEFFLATCKRLQLDPFARQIWFVKRRQKVEDHFGNETWIDVGRPETGIDGYRTVAERTGEYEGQGPMQWCGPDGKWREVWLDDSTPPAAAKATILRKGFREPLVNVSLFREFCPVLKSGAPTQMWRRMPANQIAKCAEAGAFRRAFPRDLSGITTDTEMEHVDVAGSGFSAPAMPAAKQLEAAAAKPASVQVPAAVEPELPRDTTKQGDGTPAGTTTPEPAPTVDDVHGDTAKLIASLRASGDEIDAEMAKLIELLGKCETRDEIGSRLDFGGSTLAVSLGAIVSQAKLRRKQTADDAYANAVLDVLEPQLQKRWRELAPSTSSKKGARR